MNEKAATFVNYNQVPKPAFDALTELEQFICDLDGKTMGTPTNDGRAFVDEGVVYANDAVKAFNVLVGELTNLPPLRREEALGECGLETIQTLLDLLNPLHGNLDNQLYDERRKQSGSEMDIPRDAEFSVNITEGQERDLTQAVLTLEDRKRAVPSHAAGQEWRGISSAPKNDGPDDEKIDLYGARIGRCTDCYWCEATWVSVGADGTECEVRPADVTHWMPRPKPPLPAPSSTEARSSEKQAP